MKKHARIDGQFAPRTIEMLRSPAMRALSLTGRRILDRIEIELARHGGRDNGRLPVTHTNFETLGVHRNAIVPAIREVCALGFVERTKAGRGGNGEFRSPNLFRLRYRPAYGDAPTHEWRQIKTIEEAEKIARRARRTIEKENISPPPKNRGGTTPKKRTDTTPKKRTDTPQTPPLKNVPLSREDLAISYAGRRTTRRDHSPTPSPTIHCAPKSARRIRSYD